MAKTKECIGQCVKCESDNLCFSHTPILEGNDLYYEYECDDCGHTGREVYKVNYAYSE